MSGKPASQPGLRQTMSWLHTWCGLVCGWLLCAIFLTGSISVFREPITRWMQGLPLEGSGQQPLSPQERLQALRLAEQHLSKTAPDASIWRIGLPLHTGDGVKVFARAQDGDLQASLHAQTGEACPNPPRARPKAAGISCPFTIPCRAVSLASGWWDWCRCA
jgi:uncharacterized iron-regulated membrane protein